MSGRFSYNPSFTSGSGSKPLFSSPTPTYTPPAPSPYIPQMSGGGTFVGGRPVGSVTVTQPVYSSPSFDASITAGRSGRLDSLNGKSGNNFIGAGARFKF